MNRFFLIILVFFLSLPLRSGEDIQFNSFPNQLIDCLKDYKTEVSHFVELKISNTSDSTQQYGTFFVNKNNSSSIKYIYTGRVYACYEDGCSLFVDLSNHGSIRLRREFFDYFIVYDSMPSVKKVVVYEYKATYGHEITSAEWLAQFIGYDAKNYMFVGEDIDAISGATTSVDAISEDIQSKTNKLKKYNRREQ